MKIKICGIRIVKDIEIVNKYLPDFIGFVFFKKSHRNISFNVINDRTQSKSKIEEFEKFLNEINDDHQKTDENEMKESKYLEKSHELEK